MNVVNRYLTFSSTPLHLYLLLLLCLELDSGISVLKHYFVINLRSDDFPNGNYKRIIIFLYYFKKAAKHILVSCPSYLAHEEGIKGDVN